MTRFERSGRDHPSNDTLQATLGHALGELHRWNYNGVTLTGPPGRRKGDLVSAESDVTLEVVEGDITHQPVDAIVNAANTHLAPGGGVCGAIFAAAGPALRGACAELGGAETGDAKATPAFELAARWIIHAVGPVWHGGDLGEAEHLASAYRRSLEVADELGANSIAFPAISTGIFGYPLEPATQIAIRTVRAASTNVQLVRFVCFDRTTRAAYDHVMGYE
jgi:O-acetyl-ADP-ribose deacetylase